MCHQFSTCCCSPVSWIQFRFVAVEFIPAIQDIAGHFRLLQFVCSNCTYASDGAALTAAPFHYVPAKICGRDSVRYLGGF